MRPAIHVAVRTRLPFHQPEPSNARVSRSRAAVAPPLYRHFEVWRVVSLITEAILSLQPSTTPVLGSVGAVRKGEDGGKTCAYVCLRCRKSFRMSGGRLFPPESRNAVFLFLSPCAKTKECFISWSKPPEVGLWRTSSSISLRSLIRASTLRWRVCVQFEPAKPG